MPFRTAAIMGYPGRCRISIGKSCHVWGTGVKIWDNGNQNYNSASFMWLWNMVPHWLCFVTGYQGYFTMEVTWGWKSCIIMSFTICTHHQISLVRPNKERWDGLGTLNTWYRKAIHGFGLIIWTNEALPQEPTHRLKGIIPKELWPQDGAELRLFTYFTLGTRGRLS